MALQSLISPGTVMPFCRERDARNLCSFSVTARAQAADPASGSKRHLLKLLDLDMHYCSPMSVQLRAINLPCGLSWRAANTVAVLR